MANIRFSEFNGKSDDWVIYQERLAQYYTANSITSEQMKVATLLSIIGAETYKLLRDLSHPKLPKERKYDELMVLLTKQYGPQVNVWRERRKFYEAKQEINENVADYYARIRSLSVNCNFEKNLTDILKDKLISGLKRGPILDRVCEEETDKSLEELVTLALKRENQETNYEQGKEVNFMKKSQGSERTRANQGHRSGSNHHHHGYPQAQNRLRHDERIKHTMHSTILLVVTGHV
ncbi:hypothetical protein NQ315_015315 [Exocentrus adspersus]|uniref:Retrotransposon gag domain-containing protein n=1 Tax=Exocentrus adspersus TaxID=1586481 RepID=A0AAV8V6H7_9CUCU|nr:hypothetical protein NQ315_015315 [Exocentrus adspersus]